MNSYLIEKIKEMKTLKLFIIIKLGEEYITWIYFNDNKFIRTKNIF